MYYCAIVWPGKDLQRSKYQANRCLNAQKKLKIPLNSTQCELDSCWICADYEQVKERQ